MRIALVIDALSPGGAERQALNAVMELTRLGADAELIYYTRTERMHEHEAFDRAKVTLLPKARRKLGYMRELGRYLRQGRFEVVHGFKGTANLYSTPAARMAGIRAVFAGYRGSFLVGGAGRLAYAAVARLACGWIVNSSAIGETIVRSLGERRERIHVVHNGIDPERFVGGIEPGAAKERLGLRADQPVVAMFARLTPEKNHGMFLEAARAIGAERPETRFLVVGDGDLRGALEARSRALGVAERVVFLGHRGDVAEVLSAADVCVLTSDHEGFPNALIEAMSARRPIVTTDFAGVEEVIQEPVEGWVVPKGNVRSFAEAVNKLLGDEGLRRQLGERGRAAVESRYGLRSMGMQLLAVYRSAAGSEGDGTCEA